MSADILEFRQDESKHNDEICLRPGERPLPNVRSPAGGALGQGVRPAQVETR
ncbi:MAG TPA: hypothetical protein VGQ81_13825 [Acidobacteriota bacterium]|nr:hypothetical protein [Acidobacteriota bacterium]